jgi:hypothetical protein
MWVWMIAMMGLTRVMGWRPELKLVSKGRHGCVAHQLNASGEGLAGAVPPPPPSWGAGFFCGNASVRMSPDPLFD